jgi:hypothetical protein
LDLVVNNVNMQAFVYENHTNEVNQYNYLKLKFEGGEKNRFAIGTSVKLYYDGNIVLQELIPSRGFQSSMDYPMTIGLGSVEKVDSIRVIWPNDKTTQLLNIAANQTLLLKQSEATETYKIPAKLLQKPLLSEISNTSLIKHEENNYNDFDYEGLLGKLISQEGPCMAVGDVNNDGHEDIFIGGAKGQSGSLFIHTGNGSLDPKKSPSFMKDASFEDTAAAFLDVDNDNDLDLMIGSGGNQVDEAERESIRLYINDGKGNFTKGTLPAISNIYNISVIAPNDVDGDGDLDVFVGSRSIVGVYGIDPSHLFLENIGNGIFEDRSKQVTPAVKASGMITDAKWVNLEPSASKVLVTVSDWGAPKIYTYENGKLVASNNPFADLDGWWNIIQPADLDGDGDTDFVLGNQGKNLHYKPSKENEMKLWINDFDNNGTYEQIITQNINGKDMPIHQKREMTAQMVSLKKQNLKASEYAKKSIQELFSKSTLENTTVKTVTTSETIIAINEGNGKFRIQALPARTQFSCVCGITCADVNNDGAMDIIMGGNNFEFKPQFSRLDSDYGSVLLNDGNEKFTWQDYNTSGFFIRDEVKHIQQFKDKNGKTFIIVAINNNKPRVFELHP